MEVVMLKSQQGFLVPLDEDEGAKTRRWKSGAVVTGKFTVMRNGSFFRKWWALAKLAFEMWSEELPTVEHRGQPVLPEFDRFRRDLTILAGYYRPVFAANGELRLEAESLSWSKMDEDKFERLYSATIDAILQKVLRKKALTEAQLREAVDNVLRFS